MVMAVSAKRRRRGLAAALTLSAALLAVGGIAASHTIKVKPGYHPRDVNPHELPLRSGTPKPDRVGGDHTASGDPPGNCWNRGPVDGAYRGTLALQRYLDRWFRGSSMGIYNCRTMRDSSAVSIHAEGRALDWRLLSWERKERRAARRIRHFFLGRDSAGKRFAGARRWGVQQIIYNDHHWSASHPEAGWHDCDGCGHYDHMHIEQNWRGAKRRTTAFDGYRATHEGPHPCRAARSARASDRVIPC
jgi:hypothetical protein